MSNRRTTAAETGANAINTLVLRDFVVNDCTRDSKLVQAGLIALQGSECIVNRAPDKLGVSSNSSYG